MPRRTGHVERRRWPSGRVTWRAHWRDAAGVKQSASFDTRSEADAFIVDRLSEVNRGGTGAMEGRRTRLAEWWERWRPAVRWAC